MYAFLAARQRPATDLALGQAVEPSLRPETA